MRSVRVLVVTALAAASIGVAAAPASACQPERPCPPCSYNETWNKLMRLFGHNC
jgi:hypothetical protein